MAKTMSQINAAKGQQQTTTVDAKQTKKELIGRPFGKEQDRMRNVSITLPIELTERLQDDAMANKRKGGSDLTSVSAIIRDALERAGY